MAVVRHAGRALLLTSAVLCLSVTLIKLLGWPALPSWQQSVEGISGVLALAALAGGVWAFLHRPSSLYAASVIDRQLRLKDRISSAVALGDRAGPGRTINPFAATVLDAAESVAATARVPAAIPIRFERSWILWPVLVLTALAGILWLPTLNLLGRPDPVVVQQQIQARRGLSKQLAQAVEAARSAAPSKAADPVTARAISDLEEMQRELEKGDSKGQPIASRAAKALDQIAARTEEHARNASARTQEERDNLVAAARSQNTAEKSAGDTDLAKALRSGDLAAASEAARRLLDPKASQSQAEREAAARSLEQLSKDLDAIEQQKQSRPDPASPADNPSPKPDDAADSPPPAHPNPAKPESPDHRAQSTNPTADQPKQSPAASKDRSLSDLLRRAAQELKRPPDTPQPPASTEPQPQVQAPGGTKPSVSKPASQSNLTDRPNPKQSETPQQSEKSSQSTSGEPPSNARNQQGAQSEDVKRPRSADDNAGASQPPSQAQPNSEQTPQPDAKQHSPQSSSGQQQPNPSSEKPLPQTGAQDAKPGQKQAQPQPGKEQSPQQGSPPFQPDSPSDKANSASNPQPGANDKATQSKPVQEQPISGGEKPPAQPGASKANPNQEHAQPQPGQQPSPDAGSPTAKPDPAGAKPDPAPHASSTPNDTPSENPSDKPRTQTKSPAQSGHPGKPEEPTTPSSSKPVPSPDHSTSDQPQPGEQQLRDAAPRQPGGAGPQPNSNPSADGPGSRPAQQPGADPRPDPNETKPLENLANRLEQLAKSGQGGDRNRQATQDLRRRAQELLDKSAPEQREELRQWADRYAREQDRADPPAQPRREGSASQSPDGRAAGADSAGSSPGRNPVNSTPSPMPSRTEIVDARSPSASPADPERGQVAAEWLSSGDRASNSQSVLSQRIEQSTRSAERAIEDRSVPPRFDRLLERYFRRLPDQLRNPTPPPEARPASEPKPAKDAQ